MPGTERERVPTFGHPDVGLKGPTPWHHCANLSERAWGTVGGSQGLGPVHQRGLRPVYQWALRPACAPGTGGSERLRREQAS